MPNYVVVNTINTALNREYDFGVHAEGCADLKRGEAKHCLQYPHTADNPDEVIAAEQADLAADFGEDGAEGFTFKVFPCCK